MRENKFLPLHTDISFPKGVYKKINERRFGCEMDNVKQLAEINWWYIVLAMLLLLVCIKFVWSLFDWLFVEKLGLKTRKMIQNLFLANN